MSKAEDFRETLLRFSHSALCMAASHQELLKARQPRGARKLIPQLERATLDRWMEVRDWMAKLGVLSFAPPHDVAGMTPRKWLKSTLSDVEEVAALLDKRIGRAAKWPPVAKRNEDRLRVLLRRLDTRKQEVQTLTASGSLNTPKGQ